MLHFPKDLNIRVWIKIVSLIDQLYIVKKLNGKIRLNL